MGILNQEKRKVYLIFGSNSISKDNFLDKYVGGKKCEFSFIKF